MKRTLFILLFFTVTSSFAANHEHGNASYGYPYNIGRRNSPRLAPAAEAESKEGEHLLYPYNLANNRPSRLAHRVPLLEREGYLELQDLESQERSRASSISSTIDVACPVCMEENMGRGIEGNGRVKLKCGHTMCSRCYVGGVVGRISQSVERDAVVPTESFSCPLCRAEFAVPAEAIEELRLAIQVREGLRAPDEATRFFNGCGKVSAAAVCTVLGLLVVSGQFWGAQ